ncbi:MAG: hypothetical protein IJ404_03685 [Clostridia bacterium]|nr:hypothetical protein [Clostridia bacterium]
MKNSSIGKTIMKASKYVYIAGMAFASLLAVAEVYAFFEAVVAYSSFPFLAFALIVAKYLLIVFGVWFFSLIVAGYGRIVEDNSKKAKAAEELNSILLMWQEDTVYSSEDEE